jgi:putative glutamine transport system substrate-binding protein
MNIEKEVCMLKKLLCILIFIGIFLSGCSSIKPKNDFKTIKKRGRIIVGVRSDTKPFGYRNIQGNLQGFDIDLARAIAKHIFADTSAVELVPVTAANRISMLNTGRVDILIATMSITNQRSMVVDFSKPYYTAGQAILVKNKRNVATIKQLNGKRVIIVYGSTGEESVRMNAPEAIIRGYKDYETAYKALKRGEADAMIADDTILYNLALDDPSVKILKKRFSKEPYAIAFRKGEESAQLKDSVNFTIDFLEHSGKLRDLQRKWGIWR